MEKEKINDKLPKYISGGTDQEIKELKAVILANPALKRYWDEIHNSDFHRGDPEYRMIMHVIRDGMGEGRHVPSIQPYISSNRYWDGDEFGGWYTHAEMIQIMKVFREEDREAWNNDLDD